VSTLSFLKGISLISLFRLKGSIWINTETLVYMFKYDYLRYPFFYLGYHFFFQVPKQSLNNFYHIHSSVSQSKRHRRWRSYLSILSESLTIPGHFCNIEATNPTVTLTGTLSFNSSAALHILFAVSLHPRHTFAADSSPAGGSLLITSHRRFTGSPHDSASRSRSGSVSENKSASTLSSCSDGSNPEPPSSRSSNDRARRRLEEGCRRPDAAEEGTDTTEREESGGAVVMEADTGVLMVQL